MQNQIAEPETALQFVIEAAIKVKEWQREDIDVKDRDYCPFAVWGREDLEYFDPLSTTDAWLILEKFISVGRTHIVFGNGGYGWVEFDNKVSMQHTLPECLRADGIDPPKALMVWAAWRWL